MNTEIRDNVIFCGSGLALVMALEGPLVASLVDMSAVEWVWWTVAHVTPGVIGLAIAFWANHRLRRQSTP